MPIRFWPIKTRRLRPPKDNLYPVLDQYLPQLREGDILVITSKVLGIHQGRCVPVVEDTHEEKNRLIMREAEWYIPPKKRKHTHWHLTIKDKTLIADAGIDKSNGDGYYILWPRNPQRLLREMRVRLRKKYKIKKLGLISVDSHLIPLRTGTMSISTGFVGFEPWLDYRGRPDIFGRKLQYTRRNVVDSLAAIAGLLMGEGAEQTPLLLIRGASFAQFTEKNAFRKLIFPIQKDIFLPLLRVYKKNPRVDKRNKNAKS